ncbi:MAG: acyltransferase [Oscillospiraceae bacterium]|nr:acyltransferase [Oscillospiraceae bacterium]
MSVRAIIRKHPKLSGMAFWILNRLPLNNSVRMAGNRLTGGIFTKCRIRVKGKNNCIVVGRDAWISHSKLTIRGNDCQIVIGDGCVIRQGDLYIEDDGGQIRIGDGTSICGSTHLASIEGKTISIGQDCLFSSAVTVRVGDSHSIMDLDGKRINPSEDVVIGDRVWVGNQTTILKGARIPADTVVATGAVVTKKFEEPGTILGGLPAKVIRKDIRWDRARL